MVGFICHSQQLHLSDDGHITDNSHTYRRQQSQPRHVSIFWKYLSVLRSNAIKTLTVSHSPPIGYVFDSNRTPSQVQLHVRFLHSLRGPPIVVATLAGSELEG